MTKVIAGNTIDIRQFTKPKHNLKKMQYITLEHIDEYLARKAYGKKYNFWHICKEVFQFGVVFLAVFLVSTITVNAQLFYHTAQGLFSPVRADDVSATLSTLNAQQDVADAVASANSDDQSRFLEQQVQSSIAGYSVLPDHTETMNSYLSAKMKDYSFQFNTLPPENRIIIPAISVNAPIVDVSAATEQQIKHGDFDQELYSGVVKFPSTPEPGTIGNSLIFGHTSYYWWKKNPFAEVFAKLPALTSGDLIQVLWHGQLSEFEVVEKIVVNPGQVDDTYLKYTDGSYITLMGCYPIGSDSRRILIIAKKKTSAS